MMMMFFVGTKIKHACKSTNKKIDGGGGGTTLNAVTDYTEFKIIIKMQKANVINDYINPSKI